MAAKKSPHERRQEIKAEHARRDVVKLAEVAYEELSLPGSMRSRADEERLHRMWRGLKALDDEAAEVKDELLELVTAWEKNQSAVDLIVGLRALMERKPPKGGRWTKPA